LLHDIGKLGVPDAILFKTSSLSEEEYKVMHDHLQRGINMVSAVFSLPELNEILRYSHTWFGGNVDEPGLPTGENIPLGARILAIADAFSTMVSKKPYREPLNYEEAFEELRRCAPDQFDPELVERFIEAVGDRNVTIIKNNLGISEAVKLEINQEVEKIAFALNCSDLSLVSVTASRLAAMAVKQGVQKVADLASEIERAVTKDRDLVKVIQLTTDLMEACCHYPPGLPPGS
ncbi:unnamed protein product, partial [marine sediment metagenome]